VRITTSKLASLKLLTNKILLSSKPYVQIPNALPAHLRSTHIKLLIFVLLSITSFVSCEEPDLPPLEQTWYDPIGIIEFAASKDGSFSVFTLNKEEPTKGTYRLKSDKIITSLGDTLMLTNDSLVGNSFTLTTSIQQSIEPIVAGHLINGKYQLLDTRDNIIDTIHFQNNDTYRSYYKNWEREWKLVQFRDRDYLVIELTTSSANIARIIKKNDGDLISIYYDVKDEVIHELHWNNIGTIDDSLAN